MQIFHGTSITLGDLDKKERATIKRIIAPAAREIYKWAKLKFETLLRELGDPFEELVNAFKSRVKLYQDAYYDGSTRDRSPYRWAPVTYENGSTEYC